jgi:Luciferase-like monooxygenase
MTRSLDPVLLWAVAAAATSRMGLHASTLSTFYYEPPHLARLLTTLDVLSDGRLPVVRPRLGDLAVRGCQLSSAGCQENNSATFPARPHPSSPASSKFEPR